MTIKNSAQYTAHGFHRLLHEHGITQSFPILAALMTVRWPSPSLLHTSYKICMEKTTETDFKRGPPRTSSFTIPSAPTLDTEKSNVLSDGRDIQNCKTVSVSAGI